jgi:hypothetical protein
MTSLKINPLTDENWILPGQPADEKEIEQLINEMNNDVDEGISTLQLEKEIAKWNKGIYK